MSDRINYLNLYLSESALSCLREASYLYYRNQDSPIALVFFAVLLERKDLKLRNALVEVGVSNADIDTIASVVDRQLTARGMSDKKPNTAEVGPLIQNALSKAEKDNARQIALRHLALSVIELSDGALGAALTSAKQNTARVGELLA